MRKMEEDQGTMLLRYGKAVLLGGLSAFVVSLALLLLFAAGVSRGILEEGLRYQLTVVSCVLSSFTGGLLAVRKCPARSLFVGLVVGGVLFLIQITLGFLFFERISLESGGVGLLFGALCGGAAAGILSGGGKKKSGRRPKRRNR